MILDPRSAGELVDVCAAAIVVLGVGLAATHSIGRSIWLVAVQSVLVGVAAIGVGLATAADHLVIGGLLAIAAKGVVVPLVLGSILRRSPVRRERDPMLGQGTSLVAAVIIVFAASAAADGALVGASVAVMRVLPAAIAAVLTGLLIVMTRRKALSLIIGLLVFENGIALTAFSLTYGMPFVVELGVLFDLLITVVVAWVYARRMLDVFGSTSTDQLRMARMIEVLVALTVAVPAMAGLAAWFAGERQAPQIAAIGFAMALVAGLALAVVVFTEGPARAFGGLVVVDALGAYILALVLVIAAITLAGSSAHVVRERAAGRLGPRDPGRYYALLLWFVAGLAAVPLLDNLGLLWVGIEATTIVSALLVGFARTPAAIEAAWKYLILGSIGIGFALLGTLLLYASSVGVLGETSDALTWTRLMGIAPRLDPGLARLAFILALAGYGTKAGLVPFHTWLPDAHSQAPSPVSSLLSGAALAVALYALARFQIVTTATLGPEFPSTLLVIFGLLGLVVALPFIVAQGDLKRLLAYSSIEHLGLATLALGFGGQLAFLGLAVHLFSHGLAKATIFLAAGQLVAERGSRRIGRLGGSLAGSPADGRALIVAALVLAGLPPSGIFVAEIAILFGGVEMGWGLAAGAAAALLALAVAGFLFHMVQVSVGPPGPARTGPPASRRRAILLGAPLAIVVVVGLWTPPPLAAALDQVVAVLEGGHG